MDYAIHLSSQNFLRGKEEFIAILISITSKKAA